MPSSKALGKMEVGNILTTAAVRYAQQEALYCSSTGRRVSFAQLHARANQLANAWLAQGLRKGDCVAFLSSNRAEMAEIYFALARSGLVGMPLNYRLAPVEAVALMREVNAVALVYERRFADTAALVRQELAQVREYFRPYLTMVLFVSGDQFRVILKVKRKTVAHQYVPRSSQCTIKVHVTTIDKPPLSGDVRGA